MLFHYQLKQVFDCALPVGEDRKKVSWFCLTDSFFHIDLGEEKLYESSPESIDRYKLSSPYNDYYYIRFLEDFFDILPKICSPVPQKLYSHIESMDKRKQLKTKSDSWYENIEPISEKEENDYYALSDFVHLGMMDTGYLAVVCDHSFNRVGDTVYIQYDFKGEHDNGIPVWSAGEGGYSLSYAEFLASIEKLLDSFFTDMDKQVAEALSMVETSTLFGFDKEYGAEGLINEHNDRKKYFYRKLFDIKNNTFARYDYKGIEKLLRLLI